MCLACGETDELPVVARGKYVELATDRDDRICGGTIGFYDRFIEAGFAFIGESPPDRVFLRYEWAEGADPAVDGDLGGRAGFADEGIRIRTDYLIHEHELAHAVHLEAWGHSARFLDEGFAALLDPRRPTVEQQAWPDELPLDEVLEGTTDDYVNTYAWGWFLVSQILADHGVAGLRDLWHAVPSGASAQEVRDAYQSLFGRPMDTLIEPYVVHSEFEGLDGTEVERYHCDFTLCTGKTVPWVDNTWEASGPTGCEDDPEAIGPFDSFVGVIGGAPPVWRDYVLPRAGPYESQIPFEDVYRVHRYCSLDCVQLTAFDYGQGPAPDEPWRHDQRERVQIHTELDALPTETPLQLRYTRPPP